MTNTELVLRSELKALSSRFNEAVAALEELMDIQNGPPLCSWEKEWNAAMERARIVTGRTVVDTQEEG